MMCRKRAGSWLWVAALVGGCVPAGRIESDLIGRYQRSVLRGSPQRRVGETGLDALRPTAGTTGPKLKVVKDPAGKIDTIPLALAEAVRRALMNNMDIRVVSFDPAISREQMIQAAAAFDVAVFGGVSHARADRPTASPFLSGKSRTIPLEVGLRKTTTWGGQVEWTWDLTRTSDDSAFSTLNPRYESATAVQLSQPLLRGAGRDFNLAALRIARLGHKTAASQFRQTVEQVVTEVETAYWRLAQAAGDVTIQKALLKRMRATLEKVRVRFKNKLAALIDVRQAEAAVFWHEAVLVRLERGALDAQDALATLLADAQINVLRRYLIVPVTEPITEPVTMDRARQLVAALRHSPVLQQARLAIAAADIQVRVARNETLPSLTLTASTGLTGLRGTGGKAMGQMTTFDYLDHSIGVTFEQPLGNRSARARLRQRRLERLQAISRWQNVADQVAMRVSQAVQHVRKSHEELTRQRVAAKARREHARILEANPDAPQFAGAVGYALWLDHTLRSQELLATAERAVLQATIEYNAALAALSQATGTTLQRHHVKLDRDTAEDLVRDVLDYRSAPPGRTRWRR